MSQDEPDHSCPDDSVCNNENGKEETRSRYDRKEIIRFYQKRKNIRGERPIFYGDRSSMEDNGV